MGDSKMRGLAKILALGIVLLLAGFSPAVPGARATGMAGAASPAEANHPASAHDRRNHHNSGSRHRHRHHAHH
jgi:hypothetical protein